MLSRCRGLDSTQVHRDLIPQGAQRYVTRVLTRALYCTRAPLSLRSPAASLLVAVEFQEFVEKRVDRLAVRQRVHLVWTVLRVSLFPRHPLVTAPPDESLLDDVNRDGAERNLSLLGAAFRG